jgi:2-phosphosulfolactate phosphatase
MPTLHVHALPTLVTPEEMAGGIVVVIDILRASTTIAYALEAGATEVIPCLEVEEALELFGRFATGEAVLGGERNGLRIEGFDLGNSPREYTPESVGARTVIFTTTNGTRALDRCRLARRVLMGSFVNASETFEQLLGRDNVHLLCAGTRGQIGRDDMLFAGLLVERLQRRGGLHCEMNAQAITARENWTSSFAVPYVLGAEPMPAEVLARELRRSQGGRNLIAIGLEADILTASEIDRFQCVPELDIPSFRIRLHRGQ